MKYKNLFLLLFAGTLFYFAVEWGQKLIFSESTPVWKLILIGFISAVSILIPIIKRNGMHTTGFRHLT